MKIINNDDVAIVRRLRFIFEQIMMEETFLWIIRLILQGSTPSSYLIVSFW